MGDFGTPRNCLPTGLKFFLLRRVRWWCYLFTWFAGQGKETAKWGLTLKCIISPWPRLLNNHIVTSIIFVGCSEIAVALLFNWTAGVPSGLFLSSTPPPSHFHNFLVGGAVSSLHETHGIVCCEKNVWLRKRSIVANLLCMGSLGLLCPMGIWRKSIGYLAICLHSSS